MNVGIPRWRSYRYVGTLVGHGPHDDVLKMDAHDCCCLVVFTASYQTLRCTSLPFLFNAASLMEGKSSEPYRIVSGSVAFTSRFTSSASLIFRCALRYYSICGNSREAKN